MVVARQAEMEPKVLFLLLLCYPCQGGDMRNSVVPCDNATDFVGYSVPGPVPGLMCGETCLATALWCKSDSFLSCGTFTSSSAKLCQNLTLWKNKDCTQYVPYDGRVRRYGRRCTGKMKGCNWPAYMTYDYHNSPCSDKSDQIHKIGSCTIDQHLHIYTSLFCNDTNTETKRGDYCEEILRDPSGWILGLKEELKNDSTKDWRKKRFRITLDPHNCQASCLTPDYGCEACTNTSYFRCPVKGEPHCLHPHLECDGHPQCDNKEDENGCPSSSTGLKSSNKEGHKLFFLIFLIFPLIEIS